jgi:hypothetical protein
MCTVKKTGVLLAAFFLLSGGFIAAQDSGEVKTEDEGKNLTITPPKQEIQAQPPSRPPLRESGRLFTPLNSAMIWSMTADSSNSANFDDLDLAKNPASPKTEGKTRPAPSGVYFGVPPKSASSVISLGVVGTDVDRFLSATSFSDTSYKNTFGYFSFDKDSLSAGISRKFNNGAITSLYYNGNIVEDIFAYLSNNSLTNGKVGMGAEDSNAGTKYDFMGDLKDRNNINSRSNIDLMFGLGQFGVTVGYSQKLFGLVKKSNADIQPDPISTDLYQGAIRDAQEAILDNALVPHVELGFCSDFDSHTFKMAFGLQLDIHSHRELARGTKWNIPGYFDTSISPPYDTVSVSENTQKLSADYLEPALALRLEFEFPSDTNSALAIGIESGFRMKYYSNMDDRGGAVAGIFWSEDKGGTALGDYTASVATGIDLDVLLRPSVRFIMDANNRLRLGLSAGFGVGLGFGDTTTKTYQYRGKNDFMGASDPYAGTPYETKVETPSTDLGLYPNLGVGFQFWIVPNTFALNGGIGATQTLYRLRTGTIEITDASGNPQKVPLFEQSWGKPLAQLALGATFNFQKNAALDALFSSNGTSFDNANIVLQFTAKL